MKIRKYTVGLLLAAMAMTSCSDFLDKMPENTIPTEETDFTDLNNMYAPVSGMYATARVKLRAWEIWPLLGVRGDEVTKGGSSDNDQFDYLKVERFDYDGIKGFWALNNMWNAFYSMVYTSHQNMDLLENFRSNIKADDQKNLALADQYEAEIRFLRAHAYFLIHNAWGEVPIIDGDDLWRVDIPKRKVEAVKAYIHEELDFAITHLPEAHPSDVGGRITKYTALALKAKLALYEQDYQTAKEASAEVINSGLFQLEGNFYDLFKVRGKLSRESLYELQFTDFEQGSGDQISSSSWFGHQGPSGGTVPVSGWGFMLMEDQFAEFMKERGESDRFDGSLLTLGATTRDGDAIPVHPNPDNAHHHYLNGKAYTPASEHTEGRTNYGANNNIRVLRYADVLLINAEANLQIGGDALTPLNEVRKRAGIAELSVVTLDDIINERRAEMSVEWGDRFYDLVRTGKAATTLPGFVAGKHEYLPIPTAQEDLNTKLKEEAI